MSVKKWTNVLAILAVVATFVWGYWSSSDRRADVPSAAELGGDDVAKQVGATTSKPNSNSQAESNFKPGATNIAGGETIGDVTRDPSRGVESSPEPITDKSKLPDDLRRQLENPQPDLPPDLRAQLESQPTSLPPDLQAQLDAPPPPIPEDIKRALATPPRVVSIEEVNGKR